MISAPSSLSSINETEASNSHFLCIIAANAKRSAQSWLICHSLKAPTVKPSLTTLLNRKKHETFQATYTYAGAGRLRLVHVLQVGDGAKPTGLVTVKVNLSGEACEVRIGKRTFMFGPAPDFKVAEGGR